MAKGSIILLGVLSIIIPQLTLAASVTYGITGNHPTLPSTLTTVDNKELKIQEPWWGTPLTTNIHKSGKFSISKKLTSMGKCSVYKFSYVGKVTYNNITMTVTTKPLCPGVPTTKITAFYQRFTQ